MSSQRSLNIMVTSGGTRVHIDDVRVITNLSGGTTGARIAECALESGHHVDYVHTAGATKLPFEEKLRLDVGADPEKELARVQQDLHRIRNLYRRLSLRPVDDFNAYNRLVGELLQTQVFDAVFMAMAASDYGPRREGGKIRSDANELNIRCEKLPKVVDSVKKIREHMLLVGFKLLSEEAGQAALLERAHSIIEKGAQDMVVANLVDNRFRPTLTSIVSKSGVIPVDRREMLAPMLIEQLEDALT